MTSTTPRPTPLVDSLFEEFINAGGEKDVIDYHAIMRRLDLLARQLERDRSELMAMIERLLCDPIPLRGEPASEQARALLARLTKPRE